MPSRLTEHCASGITRSFDAPLSALLDPPLQSPQQTVVQQETAKGAFSLERFSRFHSGSVFVCFVCLGFYFVLFFTATSGLTQIN